MSGEFSWGWSYEAADREVERMADEHWAQVQADEDEIGQQAEAELGPNIEDHYTSTMAWDAQRDAAAFEAWVATLPRLAADALANGDAGAACADGFWVLTDFERDDETQDAAGEAEA